MAYVKQTWNNGASGGTPLSAARLNHIEDGIEDVDVALTADVAVVSTMLLDTATIARDRRDYAAVWNSATGLLSGLTASGLTLIAGVVAASVDGTDGNAILPIWGREFRQNVRASARITATKATAGSKSYVGFTSSARATLPTAGNYTFGVGYLAGTGLVVFKENVGANTVILADASIVDGTQYDVAIQADTTLGGFYGAASGSFAYRIRSVTTGLDIYQGAATFNMVNFPPNNLLIRSNVAAGAMTQVWLAGHPLGDVGLPTAIDPTYTTIVSESAFMHIPANPNGKLVIACHGHGGNSTETGWSSAVIKPTWDVLVATGFTIAVPDMGGDLWGNNVAQGYLATLYTELVALYDLDPQVYLWGNSMGGGAALTAIAKQTFGVGNVRAAYLAEPVCDLAQMYGTGSFPTIATAYPTVAERNANDPMVFPASAFAGVPMLFVASASDGTVIKTLNTDAMRTKLGSTVPNYLVLATGAHADASHFRANDTLNFFRANI